MLWASWQILFYRCQEAFLPPSSWPGFFDVKHLFLDLLAVASTWLKGMTVRRWTGGHGRPAKSLCTPSRPHPSPWGFSERPTGWLTLRVTSKSVNPKSSSAILLTQTPYKMSLENRDCGEFVMTQSQREIQERINSPAHQRLPFSLRHMTTVKQSTHWDPPGEIVRLEMQPLDTVPSPPRARPCYSAGFFPLNPGAHVPSRPVGIILGSSRWGRTSGTTWLSHASLLRGCENADSEASLEIHWWRIHLPTQETRVQSLIWEDPTCRGTTRPEHPKYWACALEPRSCDCWSLHVPEPILCTKGAPTMRSPRTAAAEGHPPPQLRKVLVAMKTKQSLK